MKSTLVLASIALLAVAASPSAPARDHRGDTADTGRTSRYEHGMRVVSNAAAAGEPGHGWRYFSNPAAHRAVVISPNGEYFFSSGEGLRLVATTQPGA